MRVLSLSTNLAGGAGVAASRFHSALGQAGFDSRLLALAGPGEQGPGIFRLQPSPVRAALLAAGRAATRYAFDYHRYFTLGSAGVGRRIGEVLDVARFAPEVIVCHWTSRLVSAQDIRVLADRYRAAVVFHVMDMEPFTGGCHYSLGCARYENACGRCPAIWPRWGNDVSRRALDAKRRALRGLNAAVVVTSEHLLGQARRSAVFGDVETHKILYGIDPGRFSPGDAAAARAALGLPEGRRMVFAGAMNIANPRKGAALLLRAFEALGGRGAVQPVTIAVAGARAFRLPPDRGNVQFRWLGYLDPAASLIAAYRAADVFVCPSVDDAGPMMVNEAIMCGTPVVSFDMGVARDLVHTGRTGYRAALGNVEDLAHGIERVLSLAPGEHASMRRECRELGTSLMHPDKQVEQFRRVFEGLLGAGRGSSDASRNAA